MGQGEKGEREGECHNGKPREKCGVAHIDLGYVLFVFPADFSVCTESQAAQDSKESSAKREILVLHDPDVRKDTRDEHSEWREPGSLSVSLSDERCQCYSE